MPEKLNQPCSVCGKKYAYTRQHERSVHGIYVIGPKAKKRKASTELVPVEKPVENHNTMRRVPNAEVITDGKRIGIVEWIR